MTKSFLRSAPLVVLILISLSAGLIHPQKASAAGVTSPNTDGSQSTGVSRPYNWLAAGAQCQAYMAHDDQYNTRINPDGGLVHVNYVGPPDTDYSRKMNASGITDYSQKSVQTYIYFTSINGDSKSICARGNMFFVLDSSDPTTLYGFNIQSDNIIKIGGTVDSPQIISVKNQSGGPVTDNGTGAILKGPDGSATDTSPNILLKYEPTFLATNPTFFSSLLFPGGTPAPTPGAGGGGAVTGAADPCGAHATGGWIIQILYTDCLYPRFISMNTIAWRRELYTLAIWAGSGQDLETNGMRYYLTKSNGITHTTNNEWHSDTQPKPDDSMPYPWLQLRTQGGTNHDTNNSLHLNIGNDNSKKDEINSLLNAFNLVGGGVNSLSQVNGVNQTDADNPINSFHLRYHDKDKGGASGVTVATAPGSAPGVDPTTANTVIVRDLDKILIVAGYNATNKAIRFIAYRAGDNEQKFMTTYGQVDPVDAKVPPNPTTYYASASIIPGCENKPPRIVLGSDPTGLGLGSKTINATLFEPTADNCDYKPGYIKVDIISDDAFAASIGDQGASLQTQNGGVLPFSCSTKLLEPLTWIMCPIINGARTIVNNLDSQINNSLTIDVGNGSSFDENDPSGHGGQQLYQAWSAVRYLSLSLLVIIALVMVISQAISSGPFDAYTVKKVLPRLVIAVIAVSLSWQLCKYLILLSNHVGSGTGSLLLEPFKSFGKTNLGGDSAVTLSLGAIGLGAGLLGLGLLGIASLALTAALAVITAFVLITFRLILAMALIIFAPLAIVLWILPNTQKAWKLWKDSFAAILLVFPIIVGFITLGRIFAAIAGRNPGLFSQIIMFIAYFGPYFALPAAFRLAGGALGTLSGMAHDKRKGVFANQKKFRDERKKKRSASRRERFSSGNTFKAAPEGSIRSKFNKGSVMASNAKKAGFRPSQMRANLSSAVATHEHDEATKFMKENHDFQSFSADDDKLRAGIMGKDFNGVKAALEQIDASNAAAAKAEGKEYTSRFSNENTLNDAAAEIMRAKKGANGEVFKKAAVRAMAPTGTAFKTSGDMMAAINMAYGSDRSGAGKALAEMKSASMGAGRVDLGGASYGVSAGALQSTFEAGNSQRSIDEATANVTTDVYATQGANVISHPSMKGSAVKAMVPEIKRRLEVAYDLGEEEYSRELARTANLYDTMSASSPQNADILREGIMGYHPSQTLNRGVGGSAMPTPTIMQEQTDPKTGVVTTVDTGRRRTIQQDIEGRRNNQDFQEVRRELNAQQQLAGQTGGGQGGGSSGTPGGSFTPPPLGTL